jgi:hypothetical protein
MITEFARFMNRRGSSTQWFYTDEVLLDGEVGIERDVVTGLKRIKIGDGSTPWNSLGYIGFPDFNDAADTDILQKTAVIQGATQVVDNDPRIPTQAEKNALAGTDGSPGDLNRYVTSTDSRMTDARPPTAHASTHSDGQSDPVTLANLVGNLTQARSHDSPDTDSAAIALHHTLGTSATQAAAGNDARFPTAGQLSAMAGTYGTPGSANKYVSETDPIFNSFLTEVGNFQVTSHSSLSLSQSGDGTYTYSIAGFSGATGFDVTKITGFYIACSAYVESYASSSNGYVYATMFGVESAICRMAAGSGLYNESKSTSMFAFVPITAGQTDLVLRISSSHGSGSFAVIGVQQAE